MKRYFILPIFLLPFLGLKSQDTVKLRELVIQDSIAQNLQSGYNLELDIDDKRLSSDRSLGDFLSRMTSIRFKNYGPGLGSTPTFRSGDATHTQVLWNGFVLNSPMLGSIDFSNLPSSQFDGVNIYSGNSSNIYTNGALGGSIHLQQTAGSAKDGLSLEAMGGSFGNFGGGMSYQGSKDSKNAKTHILLTADLLNLNNQFRYKNNFLPESPMELMRNSQFSRVNLSASLKTQLESSSIKFNYWFNGSDRQIPQPLNYYSNTSQSQTDLAHRILVGFNKRFKNSAVLGVDAFYENNQNMFLDTVWGIDNNNQYQTVQSQISYTQTFISRLKLSVRINPQWIEASTENYAKSHSALAMNGVIFIEGSWLKSKRLITEAGLRLSSFGSDFATTPFGGISFYVVPKTLSLFASYSENVRFPTFNEQFWEPGGNLNLSPEHAQMVEGGLRYQKEEMQLQALIFNGEYTDRIRWLPSPAWIYSPVNIDQSRSRGFELNYSNQKKLNHGAIFWSLNANWTEAQWITDTSEYQLSYVPALAAGGSVGLNMYGLGCSYSHQYTSERFINADESQKLPMYQLGVLSLNYKLEDLKDRHTVDFRFEINNLWGMEYEMIPWRPMPGREFIFTLRYSL